MAKLLLFISTLIIFSVSADEIQNVNLLEDSPYTWDGLNQGHTVLNVNAEKFSISVTIDSCDIGDPNSRPNKQYLLLKEGKDGKDGKIFAYVKQPKKLYFFSSSVILELKTNELLEKSCKVIFEKADAEDTTLPPPTTTEMIPTLDPGVSRYSTVFIRGKSIDAFNTQKDLVVKLKENLVEMAKNYTKLEGFCMKEDITTKNVDIHVLEQCSTKLPNFEECVKLEYALPIQIDEDCSLWKGYQLTKEHLDIMWARLADQILQGSFHKYEEPTVDKVVTWWIIGVVVTTIAFVVVVISINLTWKRRRNVKRARANQNEDFMPDVRRVSDMSLTPPFFQSIPPMFDKTYRSNTKLPEVVNGNDNEGFQYDEILNCEEDGTTI